MRGDRTFLPSSLPVSSGNVEVAPSAAGGEQASGGADQNPHHEEREAAASQRSTIRAFHPFDCFLWYSNLLQTRTYVLAAFF